MGNSTSSHSYRPVSTNDDDWLHTARDRLNAAERNAVKARIVVEKNRLLHVDDINMYNDAVNECTEAIQRTSHTWMEAKSGDAIMSCNDHRWKLYQARLKWRIRRTLFKQNAAEGAARTRLELTANVEELEKELEEAEQLYGSLQGFSLS